MSEYAIFCQLNTSIQYCLRCFTYLHMRQKLYLVWIQQCSGCGFADGFSIVFILKHFSTNKNENERNTKCVDRWWTIPHWWSNKIGWCVRYVYHLGVYWFSTTELFYVWAVAITKMRRNRAAKIQLILSINTSIGMWRWDSFFLAANYYTLIIIIIRCVNEWHRDFLNWKYKENNTYTHKLPHKNVHGLKVKSNHMRDTRTFLSVFVASWCDSKKIETIIFNSIVTYRLASYCLQMVIFWNEIFKYTQVTTMKMVLSTVSGNAHTWKQIYI